MSIEKLNERFDSLQTTPNRVRPTICLVYQGGIANVFSVSSDAPSLLDPCGSNRKRLYQGDFLACIHFARGAGAAGARVRTLHCNMAGDISNLFWRSDLENAPFSDRIVKIEAN